MELTRDHKPCDREEKRQVERAGGKVVDGRVNGDLGVSRALGDYDRRYGRKVCRGEKGREEETRRGGEKRRTPASVCYVLLRVVVLVCSARY